MQYCASILQTWMCKQVLCWRSLHLRYAANLLAQSLMGRSEGEAARLVKPLHDALDSAVRTGVASAEPAAAEVASPPVVEAQVIAQAQLTLSDVLPQSWDESMSRPACEERVMSTMS